MQVFRYNAEQRADRKFNTTGREKNPNGVKFYARNVVYAEKYKSVFDEDGYKLYDCKLEVSEVEGKFFNMESGFEMLATFAKYVATEIDAQLNDYNRYLAAATKKADKQLWGRQIADVKANRKNELAQALISNEFQQLSDFELQNDLIAELRAMGFDGYITANEVAIF